MVVDTKKQKPLVSIIVTSYNYEQYIADTIRSILNQTYGNIELIVSDDFSRDNSVEVIKSFKDPRIILLTSPINFGAAENYCKAYNQCKGKYITSIDSDDYIAANKIEKDVQYLEAHSEVDIIGSYIQQIDEHGRMVEGIESDWFNHEQDLNTAESWIWTNKLCHSSVIMKKTFHDKLGMFNNDLSHTADWDMWIRALSMKTRFHIIPEKLTFCRFHGDNATQKNSTLTFWEYAYISAKTFHPHLRGIGRRDLLIKNILGFFMHPEYERLIKSEKQYLLALLSGKLLTEKSFKDIYEARCHSEADDELDLVVDIISEMKTSLAKTAEEQNEKLLMLLNSRSYRLARVIACPLQKMKKLFIA